MHPLCFGIRVSIVSLAAVLAAGLFATVATAQLRDMEQQPLFRDDVFRTGMPVHVTLCHIPPGNPSSAHTIQVAQAAVPAHMAHGDLLGECPYQCAQAPAPCPKTGQTAPYDSCDDGEYQMGIPWPEPRFTDNGNGTVTDNLTGLIWLKDADCFGSRDWWNALSDANTLAAPDCGLTDDSVVGDWRLPNVKELQSLIDFGEATPALAPDHPFFGVQSWGGAYWSSTTLANGAYTAWHVSLCGGYVGDGHKTRTNYVWPVRGGQ